jgi:hypothetical protein
MAKTRTNNNSAATVGYEAQVWQMAYGLRGNIGVTEHARARTDPNRLMNTNS